MKIEVEIETTGSLPGDGDWEKFFQRAGVMTIATVKKRISDGLTLDGEPMLDGSSDKYSASYERWKAKRGRHPYTPGDRLRLSGDMQRSFGVLSVDDSHCDVGFSTLDAALKAEGNDRLRPTFGLSAEEVENIWDKAKELI